MKPLVAAAVILVAPAVGVQAQTPRTRVSHLASPANQW